MTTLQTFVDGQTLASAIARLHGTAGHLLKVWLTLKKMGLQADAPPVDVDTSNSTGALSRLFSCGDPEGRFYIPFAHTPRYMTMKSDASRSIIQTTIQRWGTSGSVVTCDPTAYLEIRSENAKLSVSLGRRYPLGLGIGVDGFALQENARVSLPLKSFAVWFGRQTPIPARANPGSFLIEDMLRELHIGATERELVFVDDDLDVATLGSALTDRRIFALCRPFIEGDDDASVELESETFSEYERRVRSMVSGLDKPTWMRASPEQQVRELLKADAKAILLFGPPRTGKTRVIDKLIPRQSHERSTIQIHEGWGYDYLVQGFRPDKEDHWDWVDGPLKAAIESGRKYVVLEEINRTDFSGALGEIFSLLERGYRGGANAVTLRSGRKFSIPEDVVFLMTMNTVDKSTEEVDDALLGRVAAVEFPPRSEDLLEMLAANGVADDVRTKLAGVFAEITTIYPLGHGYFADLSSGADNRQIIRYYVSRIRPVLLSSLGPLKSDELARIDNLIDQRFPTAS